MISHWLADAKDSQTKTKLMEIYKRTLATFNPYAGETEAEGSSKMSGRKPKRSQTSQDGGMGMGSVGQLVLKSVEDLIVPLGLMTGAYLLGDRKHRVQRADLTRPLGVTVSSRGSRQMEGGAWGLPVIGDSYLGSWLSKAGERILTPSTLLPLGVVFVLYMAYRRYASPREGELSPEPSILDMADKDDLVDYAARHNIDQLEPETRVPFALAMGPEVFSAYNQQDAKGGYGDGR